MTTPAFNPDDPRLTAFVLGEIDDDDRAEIEQLLEASPDAQAAVKEIEDTIGVLRDGLSSEPVPALTAEQRAAVEEQLVNGTDTTTMPGAVGTAARTQRPGARYGKLAGAVVSVAALGLLVTIALPVLQNGRESSDRAPFSSLNDVFAPAETVVAMRAEGESEEAYAMGNASGGRAYGDGGVADSAGATDDGAQKLSEYAISAKTHSNESFTSVRRGGSRLPVSDADAPADPAISDESGVVVAAIDGSKESPRTLPPGSRAEKSDVSRRRAGGKDKGKLDSISSLAGEPTRQSSQSNSRQGSGKGQPGGFSRFSDVRPRSTPRPSSSSSLDSESANAYSVEYRSGPAKPGSGRRPTPVLTAEDKPASNEAKRRMVRKPGESAPSSLTRGKKVASATAATPAGADGPPAVRNNPAETPLSAATAPSSSESPVAEKFKRGTRESVVLNGVLVSPGDLADSVKDGKGKTESLDERLLSLEKQTASRGVEGPRPDGDAAADRAVDRASTLARRRLVEELRAQLHQVEESKGISREEKEQRVVALLKAAEREKLIKATVGGAGFRRIPDPREQLDFYQRELRRRYEETGKKLEARQPGFGFGNETYEPIVENDFIVPELNDKEKRLSTISVDVDTASYANMRRFLNRDQLPPANSVRIEELVNYFKYDYAEPEGNEPFSVKTELASCPWQPNHRLAMVGLKAKTIDKAQRPPTNLVFLLDVSGSMRSSNKLPLVQQSMRLLVEEMTEDDRISIVTYASKSGVRLESTLGSKKAEILNVINGLRAGGSTNGEGGIRMAYDQANRHYFQGGANRVILCSDGDFNVGKSSDGELVELIQEKAASGVFLSVFGFGMGNLKDAKLEKLADKGNGHYGYIDNVKEAQKVFQDELVGTLYTVAKDVKLQVEFNPATVGAYRLIGYENRKLAAQDFTDDTKDAGEIGSGHTVTALYEIIPKDILLERPRIDGLKYQSTPKKETPEAPPLAEEADDTSKELLTVKLRYKKPDEEVSEAVVNDYPVLDVATSDPSLADSSDDLVFAASVASFGMNLRGSKYRGNWGFAEALESAQGAPGKNDAAQRAEFVQLVQRAMRITGQQVGPQPRTDQGPITRPGELGAAAARIKAAVGGKYRRLVKKIEVRDDFRRFGAFNDYGHWDGTEYSGHKDLLPGHWVYVYPNWYIWAESTAPQAEDKPAEKGEDK